jgi:hypothetical protein
MPTVCGSATASASAPGRSRDCGFLLLAFCTSDARVWASSTTNPDNTWVCQQAEAFHKHVSDNQLPADIVFHDADGKFGKDFDAKLISFGLRPRRLAPFSPNTNAYIERWIQSIQSECLDHFLVLGTSIWTVCPSTWLLSPAGPARFGE